MPLCSCRDSTTLWNLEVCRGKRSCLFCCHHSYADWWSRPSPSCCRIRVRASTASGSTGRSRPSQRRTSGCRWRSGDGATSAKRTVPLRETLAATLERVAISPQSADDVWNVASKMTSSRSWVPFWPYTCRALTSASSWSPARCSWTPLRSACTSWHAHSAGAAAASPARVARTAAMQLLRNHCEASRRSWVTSVDHSESQVLMPFVPLERPLCRRSLAPPRSRTRSCFSGRHCAIIAGYMGAESASSAST
mmetsp:Transcript_25448/g.73427  ORF Transcript_25448/g.73427 Transcript_25448/m.73427 type:complete len:251 (+) Transcript_25448:599-1351(+)